MKPWELLGEANAPDGTTLTLMRRDREYVILAGGKSLMSSRMHGSEEALAALAFERIGVEESPTVLIGGLGMGFTLRAALDRLPPAATVVVAELLPAVVAWNKTVLGPLAAHPLKDRRVTVQIGDVLATLEVSRARFDTVILDVDNGPAAFTSTENARIYGDSGLMALRTALKPGGVLAVWSAWEDRKFEQRLRYHGFSVATERVRARLERGGPRHTIFLATRGQVSPRRSRPAR
jgi:spermidine synthase